MVTKAEVLKAIKIRPITAQYKIKNDGKEIGKVFANKDTYYVQIYDLPHFPGWDCLEWTETGLSIDGNSFELDGRDPVKAMGLYAQAYADHCKEIGCTFIAKYGFNCYDILAEILKFLGSKDDGSKNIEMEAEYVTN